MAQRLRPRRLIGAVTDRVITFFTDQHELHAPDYEFFRGERALCFESPARAHFVRDELAARGHKLRAPTADSSAVLQQIHTPRYLAFVQSAWSQWLALDAGNAARQPFPSVCKIESAKKLLTSGVPAKDVAKNLGVSVPTLLRWVPASAQASPALFFVF